MIEVLQYYTSGFWVWLGITIGFVYGAIGFGVGVGAILKALRGDRR